MVTSRYPLWDLTHPERMEGIPHSMEGWDEAKQRTGEHVTTGGAHEADVAPMHIESERKTAKELGISMPNPTIKPLWVAAGILVLFSALPVMYAGKNMIAYLMMAVGGVMFVGFLYAWLTTPMEDPH
jgi:hypothetical protein